MNTKIPFQAFCLWLCLSPVSAIASDITVYPPEKLRKEQVEASQIATSIFSTEDSSALQIQPKKIATGILCSLAIPDLAPGRYELEFLLKGDNPQTILDPTRSLFVEIVRNAGKTKVRYPILTGEPTSDGTHHIRIPIITTDPEDTVSVQLGWETNGPVTQNPEQAYVGSMSLRSLGNEPFVENISTDKIFYKPEGNAKVSIHLFNPGSMPWSGELVLVHETNLVDRKEVGRMPVEIAPLASLKKEMDFPLGESVFGHVIRASLEKGGTVTHAAADCFAVAKNFWEVALGTKVNGFLANTGMYGDRSPQLIEQKIEDMRRQKSNWFEMVFWAPDDWGNLNPTEEVWMSGQAYRWTNARWLKEFIQKSKKEGIKAVTYGKGMAGGPSGYELLRQKPQLFLRDSNGRWGGNPDLWDFDHWNDFEFHLKNSSNFSSSWHRFPPDLAKEEALDHGINQLIESARAFGWDGVRFDGQFTAVDDLVSTRNMRRMKERIWDVYPDFLFGFNMCGIHNRGNRIPHEEREAMAGGGHWMQEAIGDFVYEADKHYTDWLHYASNEWDAARRVRELGGTYHYIYRLDRGTDPLRFYKFAIGVANGAHPIYGDHEVAPGSASWGRFLTRWGVFGWHPDIQMLDPVKAGISVEGLPHRVAWDFWVRRFPLPGGREAVAMPFVNLPETPIQATLSYPAPVADAKVLLGGDLSSRLLEALWLNPASEEATRLDLPKKTPQDSSSTKSSAKTEIALPQISKMGVLLLVLRTNEPFPIRPRERFTEPVDAKALQASLSSGERKIVVDPMRPELNIVLDDPSAPTVKRYCAPVSWSMKRVVLDDPQAETGRAAGGDKDLPGFTTGAYFYDIPAGKYKVTARVRRLPAGSPIQFSANIYENVPQKKGLAARPGSKKSKQFNLQNPDGEYQEVVLAEDYEHHAAGIASVFLGGAAASLNNDKDKNPKLLFDWVKIERLENYTDSMIAASSGLPDSVDAVVGARESVLWVRGLYDNLLGLDEAILKEFPTGKIDKMYQRDFKPTKDSLAAFGTLILPNVPVDYLQMPARKVIRDWVKSGGHLVILGGSVAFGQGGMVGTYLEEILPVEIRKKADVFAPDKPLQLKGGSMGTVYYLHDHAAKPGAEVLLTAGGYTLASRISVGKGTCTAFSGTVLGASASEADAFWRKPLWVDELASMIRISQAPLQK